MKRSITPAIAALAALALAGCGTGVNAQTAEKIPSVPGVNANAPGPGGNGTVAVRNAMLAYPGVSGYKAGAEAQVLIWISNDTGNPVSVTFSSPAGAPKVDGAITIPAYSHAAPEVKLTLNRAVRNYESVPVTVQVAGSKPLELHLPIAPPDYPAPAHTLELKEPAGGGH